jgi:hypothetical protein
MKTWGTGSFENAPARDWCLDLEDSDGTDLVEDTLRSVIEADSSLAAPASARAIAAAEIVAAMRGRGSASLPEVAEGYVERAGEAGGELIDLANQAVSRVFDDSELRERWEESDDFEEWEEEIGDLLDRLEPTGGRKLV